MNKKIYGYVYIETNCIHIRISIINLNRKVYSRIMSFRNLLLYHIHTYIYNNIYIFLYITQSIYLHSDLNAYKYNKNLFYYIIKYIDDLFFNMKCSLYDEVKRLYLYQ